MEVNHEVISQVGITHCNRTIFFQNVAIMQSEFNHIQHKDTNLNISKHLYSGQQSSLPSQRDRKLYFNKSQFHVLGTGLNMCHLHKAVDGIPLI